jgi:hypothetical protein
MGHHRRLEKARLRQRHGDVERPDFVPQRFRVPFQSKLAGGIDAQEWNRRETGERTDVDDVPSFLLTHRRQNRIDHPDDAEEIGLELIPGFLR